MAKTIAQLRTEAQTIANATVVGENTAARVGGFGEDIVDYLDTEVADVFDSGEKVENVDISDGDIYTDLSSSFVSGKCLNNSANVGQIATLAETTASQFSYLRTWCMAGDKFLVSVAGASSFRAYTFLDGTNKVLSTSGANATLSSEEIIAPNGAVLLVMNNNTNIATEPFSVKKITKSDYYWTARQRLRLKHGICYKNNEEVGVVSPLTVAVGNGTENFISGIFTVTEGERYAFTGAGANVYRLCTVHDATDKILFTSGSTSYVDDLVITIPQGGVKMVVNINVAYTPESYCDKLLPTSALVPPSPQKMYGYTRRYTDITSDLLAERKTISGNAIVDSTTNVLLPLPNNGVVEVKMNAPVGKFKVYKDTSGTFTELTSGWSHYQCVYVGDYASDYYAVLALQAEGTLTVESSRNIAKVYKIDDQGAEYDVANKSLLQGKKIAVIGDSIVQGRYPNFNASVNMCMAASFPDLVCAAIGQKEPANYGIGGAEVYNNNWKSLYSKCVNVTGYDIVFVSAGTNDYGGNVSSANFTAAYEYVIDTLLANNTSVIVVTPTSRGTADTANSQGLKLLDYSTKEKTIALAKGCKFIDFYALTNTTAFKAHLADNLHPDEMGQMMLADFILTEVI